VHADLHDLHYHVCHFLPAGLGRPGESIYGLSPESILYQEGVLILWTPHQLDGACIESTSKLVDGGVLGVCI
jgi:hypothetical protein